MLKFETVDAAGGLVINHQDQVLFIFKDGRWDLPKGLIDRSNDAAGTARKEVSEETGLSETKLKVVSELIPTSHVSKYAKRKTLKTTRWFLLRFEGEISTFKPQRSEGIEHCQWISIWDLDRPLANCPSRIEYLIRFWLKARTLLEK